ncbi:hypothetical protein QJQ45_024364 [Haematococcus lacustris]|nr:hypothetical protein QJQ45_024364 [Haematococcus lacustris]
MSSQMQSWQSKVTNASKTASKALKQARLSAVWLLPVEQASRNAGRMGKSSEQRKREYVESAPQHQERLAAHMTALQSVIQTAISEDWQHHACASGATRLEDSPLKPLQVMQVEYISMQDRFKLRHAPPMRIIKCVCVCCHVAFLEALNAAYHPLALYPPQQIRTDSFSQGFFDYLRAIDRLLSMPRLLQQRSDLQAQLPRGAFSDRPICALIPGVPQDGYVHCVAGDACNKPSSYAGVAKATRDLEQHTDTYLDRSGLEGAVQQLRDSGQLCLEHLQRPELQQRQQELEQTQRPEISNITAGQPCAVRGVVGFVCCHGVPLLALYCNMRTAKQFVYYLLAWHAACDMLHLYNDFACQYQRMGQSDMDTRAASNAIKAKLRTARQLLKEAALYQALGSGEDAAAVSIIEEQLQAMHMIVVCKGACGEPEAHGEAESGQLQQSLHIVRLFYIKQHMQQYQDMLIKAEGMHMSLEGRGTCNTLLIPLYHL